MTAIRIREPVRLRCWTGAVSDAVDGTCGSADPGVRRGNQSPGHPATPRTLSAACRRLAHSGAGSRSVIAALGEEVRGWRVGDQVCALVTGGGYAQYVNVPAVQCLPVPAGLSLVQAATLPETFSPCG
ncbi:MAG: hypothetical protein WDM77_20970 [Steroidobacteraceae bacterium]